MEPDELAVAKHGVVTAADVLAGHAGLVPLQNVATGLICSAYAARWYSLIRPPSTFRRCTGADSGTTTISS